MIGTSRQIKRKDKRIVSPESIANAKAIAFIANRNWQQIHFRAADKLGNKFIGRMIIQVQRGAKLLNLFIIQHKNPIAHGHRFDLIVGNINQGHANFTMQPRNFFTHFGSQLGIKV